MTVRKPPDKPSLLAMRAATRWRYPNRSWSSATASASEPMCFRGTTSMWVGAWGLMSRNAYVRSSSKTFFDGISPAIILQNKQGMSHILLAEISWMGAGLPGIVTLSESLASGDRRVGIGPENNKRRRVRILERFLPQALERLGIYRLGIGNDAMDDLATEDIRLMLLSAADAVGNGLGKEREDRKPQEQYACCRPVFERSDMPTRPIAQDKPTYQVRPHPQEEERQHRSHGQSAFDVVQHIMPQLVAENQQDLIRR